MSVEITTYCGLDCTTCEYVEKCGCKGCHATQGHPFHGECDVAKCAISKNRRFCGECAEFQNCELIKSYSYDEKNGDNGARIENCKKLKQQLVAEAREGVDPVAPCGFYCGNCFLGEWCGSCRSDYNCCSFATLYEDGKCPNLTCSAERGYDGCWECPELDTCLKGYFSKTEEHLAKGSAMFIRKHGKDKIIDAINKTIADGFNVDKLNEIKTDLDMLALIEAHI